MLIGKFLSQCVLKKKKKKKRKPSEEDPALLPLSEQWGQHFPDTPNPSLWDLQPLKSGYPHP